MCCSSWLWECECIWNHLCGYDLRFWVGCKWKGFGVLNLKSHFLISEVDYPEVCPEIWILPHMSKPHSDSPKAAAWGLSQQFLDLWEKLIGFEKNIDCISQGQNRVLVIVSARCVASWVLAAKPALNPFAEVRSSVGSWKYLLFFFEITAHRLLPLPVLHTVHALRNDCCKTSVCFVKCSDSATASHPLWPCPDPVYLPWGVFV